ncbi:uncharacterized protein LOC100898365 [Galendromus occidentalis]|uniref:Uncharacterized protein LOC100898365 n=1 Tax=Galendromus occidentalis TaxID=34638 RepID=A0AAJ6QWE0_9ACAR|nr:uncharacterized protein LOC100898365 [Galendromus occidentalis]
MEIPAREMEINSSNPNHCANFNIVARAPPAAVENQCVVQLVNMSKKVFDQLQDDSAPARDFVQEIEMSTGALIKAVDREMTRLSPGQHFGQQKARKEYFFQVAGSVAQVERAKDELERTFKNQCHDDERVSLKMDVSFSDHSFIIGRFGRGIQNVSHETNCLIHFPDSNKNKQYEKSNQVSISGPPEGVLEARRRIRKLLPISFAFVIADAHHNDAMWQVGPQIFEVRPRVQEMINILQNEHRITITMLPMHSLQSSAALVTVRGRHANIDRIKDGILKLMAFLAPDNPQLSVYVGIEVSPHHLDFVTGPSGIKLFELMRETNTTIEIPEILDRRQSIPTVRIVGQVLNVYDAWVKFMDLLPLALLVEIPADASPIPDLPPLPTEGAWSVGDDNLLPLTEDLSFASSCGASRIDDIAHTLNEHLEPYDITLISRQKSREIREINRQWWLVIKGPEKYVDIMFEIHKSLNKDDPVAHVLSYIQEIPEPARYSRYSFRPSNRIGSALIGSDVDRCFRPGAADLTNAWAAPPNTAALRQRSSALNWSQDEATSSMTSTPIKPTRQTSSQVDSSSLPNSYWKEASNEPLPSSFLSALEESMDSVRLASGRSSNSGCAGRDSFALNGAASGYSSFRAPSVRTHSLLGTSSSSTGQDQACSFGKTSHPLFDDDILRDCLKDLPSSSNTLSDMRSCASNGSSFDSFVGAKQGFGNAPLATSSDIFFGNSKRPTYKDHPRHSFFSSYSTESDFASRSTKSLDLDSASPMHSDLGNSDSGYSVLKEGFGNLDFDAMCFKTTGERANDASRYNLWGQDNTRGKTFDAAPGSGREGHS